MPTGWFQSFVRHTFHGDALLTEEVLRDLLSQVRETRAALLEIFQEIGLAMQALDVLELRMSRLGEHPAVQSQGVPDTFPPPRVVQPVALSRDQRQREGTG